MTKSEQLRTLLQHPSILKAIGAHNALGAKLAEKIGFDAVWSSGFEIATAHGVPDANILTMTETLEAAQNINSASTLPIICDCDTGYGNAINAMHMVQKYEASGLAAVVIEDKRFPKMNSFIPGLQELATLDEFVAKIHAMKAARRSSEGILIFARIEALIAGWGMEEAYRRAAAYEEAGADGLVIHSKAKSPKEILEFAALWKKNAHKCPLIAIPTTYYEVTAEELADAGYRIVIYANQGMRASVFAMREVLSQILRDGTTRNVESKIASMDELFYLQGMPSYQEQEKLYSAKDQKKASVVIPAAADHKSQPDLSSLLRDQPLCLVSLSGKSLIDHQMESLSSLGMNEFTVVVGYAAEKIRSHFRSSKINLIQNDDYQNRNSAHSVLKGLEKQQGKTLVLYSDILFDPQIPQDLLDSSYPITVVIDRAFRSLPRRDKSLDLVLTENKIENQSRRMEFEKYKRIQRIGKKIDPSKSPYEFIGMILLSKEGLQTLKAAWQDALSCFKGKAFYEAACPEKASMTDLLQYTIDRGAEVYGMVIEHGWSELYSLEDYRRLEQYFSEKNRTSTASLVL